jgi:hypothetical protein
MLIPWRKTSNHSYAVGVRGRRRAGPRRKRTATPIAEVLEGRALLTFPTVVTTGVGRDPTALAVADFNSDGKPDIAVAVTGSNTVDVLTIRTPPPGPGSPGSSSPARS